MATYIRVTKDMGNGVKFVSIQRPSQYFAFKIVWFLLCLWIIWPLQLIWFGVVKLFELLLNLVVWFFKFLWRLITWPFRGHF